MGEQLLAGIRVVDLTTVVVGPAATLRLADYGAEIIKIEAPEGDLMRVIGGPSHSGELSGKFMHFNRSKRFACLNLKLPSARTIMQKLIARCDVFISNIRPNALERLGLDARACLSCKPDLIHCLITGFGPGGPYRGRPAYDTVLQGASGIAGLTQLRDGAPSYAPFLAVDHVVGEIAAGAIAAALFKRTRTGKGSALEIPMHETMAGFVLKEHLGAATFDPPLGPPGDMRVLDSFNRPWPTQDGWITITANSDAQAAALLRTIGREDLITDPRFLTVADRYRNASAWFGLRTALENKPTALLAARTGSRRRSRHAMPHARHPGRRPASVGSGTDASSDAPRRRAGHDRALQHSDRRRGAAARRARKTAWLGYGGNPRGDRSQLRTTSRS